MTLPQTEAPLVQVLGRQCQPLAPARLLERIAVAPMGLGIDLGTGDGRHVLAMARAQPQRLWLGLDAVAEAMAESSRRAAARPARGGLDNALFLRAAVERLPPVLHGRAAVVTVNYPWGSLLRGLVDPDPAVWLLPAIVALAQPRGGALRAAINLAPFQDDEYRARLGLPPLLAPGQDAALQAAWAAAGVDVHQWDVVQGEAPAATRWAGRLVRGSGRETLVIEATMVAPGAARADTPAAL